MSRRLRQGLAALALGIAATTAPAHASDCHALSQGFRFCPARTVWADVTPQRHRGFVSFTIDNRQNLEFSTDTRPVARRPSLNEWRDDSVEDFIEAIHIAMEIARSSSNVPEPRVVTGWVGGNSRFSFTGRIVAAENTLSPTGSQLHGLVFIEVREQRLMVSRDFPLGTERDDAYQMMADLIPLIRW